MKIIKDSDLRTFARCPYSYHLKQQGIKAPMLGTIATSMYFSIQKRKLLEIVDHKIGLIFPRQLHAGDFLLTREQMSPPELVKYLKFLSANSFSNSLRGNWLNNYQEEYANTQMYWGSDSEHFFLSKKLEIAGLNYFGFLSKQGAPILGFIDREIVFEFQGQKYSTKIPSIYPGGKICDVSLWSFSQELPEEASPTLDKSSLVTLRLLGITSLLQNQFFRLKFKLSEDISNTLDPILEERIVYQHFNCTKNLLTETFRTKKDLDSMCQAIETFLERIEHKQFPPNIKHCSSCPYNTLDHLLEPLCRKHNPNSRFPVPAHYFKKGNWIITTDDKSATAFIDGKEIARLTINEDETETYQTLFPILKDLRKKLKKSISCTSSKGP